MISISVDMLCVHTVVRAVQYHAMRLSVQNGKSNRVNGGVNHRKSLAVSCLSVCLSVCLSTFLHPDYFLWSFLSQNMTPYSHSISYNVHHYLPSSGNQSKTMFRKRTMEEAVRRQERDFCACQEW